MANIMSISKFFKSILTGSEHHVISDAQRTAASFKDAPQVVRSFIVKYNVKGISPETQKTEPLSLEDAVAFAISFVDSAPEDFLDSVADYSKRKYPATVEIIDGENGRGFAYLRACDEDMNLVHCLGTSSTSYFGRTSMPFVSPSYRYADVFTGSSKFSGTVHDEAFCDSDSEFAVFHRWEGMYPGHVSH